MIEPQWVLHWRYSDNAGSGVVGRVFSEPDREKIEHVLRSLPGADAYAKWEWVQVAGDPPQEEPPA